MTRYAVLALAAVALFAAGWLARQPSPPPVRYERVVVSPEEITEDEPTPEEPTIVERVTTRSVRPEQTATAPKAAEVDVTSFCAEAVQRARSEVQPDTVRDTVRIAPDPRLLVRSGTYDGRSLTVWGPTSAGGLRRIDARLRPPYEWRVSGDSLVIRQSRTWWVDDAIRAALYVGGGYLLGRVLH